MSKNSFYFMRKLVGLFVLMCLSIHLFASADKVINLKGKWSFAIDEHDQGISAKWFSKKLSDSINLPGSMVENLKGYKITLNTKFTGSIYDSSWFFNPRMAKYRQPENLKMPFWLTQLNRYDGLAWYQKEVSIPASWKGRFISLKLEHPHFITQVWIDNTEIGTQNSMTVPHV